MVLSGILDPSCLQTGSFQIPGYRQEAEQLLDAVLQNGLFVVDSDERMKDTLIETAKALPTAYGQHIVVQITELLKNNRIIPCSRTEGSYKQHSDLSELSFRLSQDVKPDGLFTSQATRDQWVSDGRDTSQTYTIVGYSRCLFEQIRKWYLLDLPPLDDLRKAEFETLIRRSTRFSRWLRFYDKQIGTAKRTSHFRAGISYIVKQWLLDPHYRDELESIEIITVAKERIGEADSPRRRKEKTANNKKAVQKITDELVLPLKEQSGLPILLRVIKDGKGLFHARHMQTENTVILFERGFDLFNSDRSVKRSIVKLDIASSKHLSELRALENELISVLP